MRHSSTQQLKTKRITLRRFTKDDVSAVYNNWANDPDVTEFLRWPAHKDRSVTQYVLNEWLEAYQYDNFYQWAIVPDEMNEPIGCIGCVSQNENAKVMHIGYVIGKKWWRQGYASEALSAVIDFLFKSTDVNRIESQHDPNNPNSGSVMKKCGLSEEGILRQADFNNRGIVDACMHSILREEWNQKNGYTD